ncbi:hypothetical protein [Lutibacter citreus]|uniref:hypothetical protein n=1 Tax=Lutibacter citreus TaxID=2138210 RepID=UPI000DBE3032|nr:hypothetical protein [Lutibacter citreus]
MELLIYERKYKENDVILNFTNFYYALNMKHLASDLLDKGLSPKQITNAIEMAIKIANSSDIDTQKHFMPVYSGINQEIIQDCKLSHLGYGLVLMNADPSLSIVGKFQIDVLKEYIHERS